MSALSQIDVLPACPYFGTCGGCTYQHLAYDEQLLVKQQLVEQELAPLGIRSVYATLPSPRPLHYRHTISLTVKKRAGALALGFMGENRKYFVPIEACAIAHELLNDYMPQALERLNALPDKRRYRTSQIMLRTGNTANVVTSLREDRGKVLTAEVLQKQFEFPISGFFQHNFSILEALVKAVQTLLLAPLEAIAELSRTQTLQLDSLPQATATPHTLLDLYCGVGLFSLPLADNYNKVFGIEEGYESVVYAKKNALANNVRNATFFQAKVESLLPSLDLEHAHAIVDPPRAGLKPEVVETLCRFPLPRLVYVSCSLSSLARDLALLQNAYDVICVQPVDLFPQTKHVENVVLLERKAH